MSLIKLLAFQTPVLILLACSQAVTPTPISAPAQFSAQLPIPEVIPTDTLAPSATPITAATVTPDSTPSPTTAAPPSLEPFPTQQPTLPAPTEPATSPAPSGGSAIDMYPDAVLAGDKARYEERIGELLSFRLCDSIAAEDKPRLCGVHVEYPLKGSHPLDAYTHTTEMGPTVVLPVLSLKFLEDLSVAYAWRFIHDYTLEPIDEYVAMLKYRNPEDFLGGRVPDPLTALGVPPRILEDDKEVDDLSLRIRNTMWAFVLAHELGHVKYEHPSNFAVAPEVSQRNELVADAYVVELFGRADNIPIGMILWLQASVGYFKNRADFATEAEYLEWARSQTTHPVNAERLQHMAVALNKSADATLNTTHEEILRFMAVQVIGIGDILAIPDIQRLVARCAILGDPEDLKRLHDRPCDERLE